MGLVLLCLLCLGVLKSASARGGESNAAVGPGSVIVHSRFGGQIFGFDIDPNGNEGIPSESTSLPGGNYLAAVETFDQTTGEIIQVVRMIETQDDFVTLGVFHSVGLVEHEHVDRPLHVQRTFFIMNPLGAKSFTAKWTPPIDQNHIVGKVRGVFSTPDGALSTSNSAVYVMDNSGSFTPLVFTSNVGANTFGQVFSITDAGNVIPAHIALKPKARSGFVEVLIRACGRFSLSHTKKGKRDQRGHVCILVVPALRSLSDTWKVATGRQDHQSGCTTD